MSIACDSHPLPPRAASALRASHLRRGLVAGARRVIADRDLLNRINVFPVADGDTGTNLAHTLGAVLRAVQASRERHAGRLLARVADAAIDGARGNSGAILAQFLHGVAERAVSAPSLPAGLLAAAVGHGARSARSALAHPVEGTMLSVIDRYAQALAQCHGVDWPGCARRALQEARDALAQTPRQMALLQKAGVVDAGAQGFVDLLEGFASALEGGRRGLRERGLDAPQPPPAALLPHAHGEVDPLRPWCCECTLHGEGMDLAGLRGALEGLGADSVVLAGGGRHLHVHAHAARPQAVFDACASVGAVEGMKADDMAFQARLVQRPARQRVAILTDSAADLPDAVLARHAIGLVPVRVTLDGRDYLDKVGLATQEFYRRMAGARELPRTSQPPPGDFRRAFELLSAQSPQVLYVGLSRAVSGTLQSAEHAAARADAGTVRVFDSANAAGGQALLAWRAAELAEAGRTLGEIEAELERLKPLTLTFALARDITHAVRGGRIPAWAAMFAGWSRLLPVARVRGDGKLHVAGAMLASARAPEAFARHVAKRVPTSQRWRVISGHCDAAADAARLLEALRARLDVAEGHVVETGPALGAHAGAGTLVVALQPVA